MHFGKLDFWLCLAAYNAGQRWNTKVIWVYRKRTVIMNLLLGEETGRLMCFVFLAIRENSFPLRKFNGFSHRKRRYV